MGRGWLLYVVSWLVGSAWMGTVFAADSAKPDTRSEPHWSFQPLTKVDPPAVAPFGARTHPIDAFIMEALRKRGLQPNPPASRLELARRAAFDLTGLPPSPEAIDQFTNDTRPDAWERFVDELLRSPRYGERWAQHWLDVVRYADTHGFEVNTERPNAWPYRDYVIRSFNRDTPYDQFIREQLAGDQFSEDSATGFMVTAAALLPGQIGADDISKRLARQDELSEIIGNTGQTFLGLTIGCARCHSHKFDPIPQRDYYAIQAYFAGVLYGDRPIRSAESEARLREAASLKLEVKRLEQSLERFEPVARTNPAPARVTDAKLNEELFPAIEARFVRFTIHDANLHPTLGLIEPCIDEFEIFSADPSPKNVALASTGTRVSASGSRTSGSHQLGHINDGRFGNSHSWMSDEAGRGWLLFELPAPVRISRIAWSRDREGMFSDRLATAYTIEAGTTLDSMSRIVHVPGFRAAVHPTRNVDRFDPVRTRRLRFSIAACTSLEPCLDELEVFTTGDAPRNIALASEGTKTRASGTLPDSTQHRLEHINDGLYGNSRSWISNEGGRGWVELEFASPQLVDRVVWGRDREGKFTDRLPTDYRIDIELPDGTWRMVAGAADRKKYSPDDKSPPRPPLDGLTESDAQSARKLLAEKKTLESRISTLENVPTVFGGIFKDPEVTRVLHRGDPEQPREEVAPSVPTAVGSRTLPSTAGDATRRLALADWIASPENPLTARVMVNRIWQGHFGMGLVDTPNDFGRNGSRPSHPELLDWLAREFIASGWSVKHLHRLILSSATYRQSSRIRPDAAEADADSRLLWRFPSRRLEGEAVRDSMLAVSGRLNFEMGGPGFNFFKSRGGLDGFPPIESFGPEGRRRMIYSHKVRMEREIVFGAFDCPDAGQTLPRRRQSTTPIQALNLFNSRFTIDESAAFAKRIEGDLGASADDGRKVRHAYRLALGREPEPDELSVSLESVREHGLASLCRVLFNSNEFLFIP